ncbi:MAG: EAL domain-containing protein [Magnetococcus sp. DMHC-1]|nr:EAL domain-containing protein [Magnetococcales bacterium]
MPNPPINQDILPQGAFDFFMLAEQMPDGVVIHKAERVLFANIVAAAMTGEENGAILAQRSFLSLFHQDSRPTVENMVQALLQGPEQFQPTEMKWLRRDSRVVPVEITMARCQIGGELVLISLVRDISKRKEAEERILHQANYDTLTGLPNRALFLDRLQHELTRAKRSRSRVALMFIDLDRFKWVNDTLGHAAGDQLLREASARLLSCHRESDTVARLGGDEFTVILPDMARGPHAERVAAQILKVLAKPFILSGQEAFISGSVGVTIFPDDGNELDELLRNADSAMYYAKNDGRNAYRFFTPDMQAEALEKVALEKDLHRAMERNELVIHYQPIFDIQKDLLVGAEGYMRWLHPKRGFISPELFIPMAEEIGLIATMTEWMLHTGCTQAQAWRSQKSHHANFFISLNLSCTRCRELSTDDKIPGILRDTGLPPTALVLEITENILSEDKVRAMSMLEHLQRLGVNLWLDDFGTGYSSLSVLKRLPVSGVKIDRAFVPEVTRDPETGLLVEAIMTLAKSMKRKVIGEGVESPEQKEYLRSRGCDYAQGYFFGRPMSGEEFGKFLDKHNNTGMTQESLAAAS